MGFLGGTIVNLPASSGDIRALGLNPGLGWFPGEGNGNALPFLPRESYGQRTLASVVHGIAKSLAWLSTHQEETEGMEKRGPYCMLAGIHIGASPMEALLKTENRTTIWYSNPTPRLIFGEN